MDAIFVFEVCDTYDTGVIRRQIIDYLKKYDFSDMQIDEAFIVVSEICSNIVKHAVVEGSIRFLHIIEEGRTGILIVAQEGSGIKNIEEVLIDGVSSKGTMGGEKTMMQQSLPRFCNRRLYE